MRLTRRPVFISQHDSLSACPAASAGPRRSHLDPDRSGLSTCTAGAIRPLCALRAGCFRDQGRRKMCVMSEEGS